MWDPLKAEIVGIFAFSVFFPPIIRLFVSICTSRIFLHRSCDSPPLLSSFTWSEDISNLGRLDSNMLWARLDRSLLIHLKIQFALSCPQKPERFIFGFFWCLHPPHFLMSSNNIKEITRIPILKGQEGLCIFGCQGQSCSKTWNHLVDGSQTTLGTSLKGYCFSGERL